MKYLLNFMHYKLLAKAMHDISNDLVPSNLKDTSN